MRQGRNPFMVFMLPRALHLDAFIFLKRKQASSLYRNAKAGMNQFEGEQKKVKGSSI